MKHGRKAEAGKSEGETEQPSVRFFHSSNSLTMNKCANGEPLFSSKRWSCILSLLPSSPSCLVCTSRKTKENELQSLHVEKKGRKATHQDNNGGGKARHHFKLGGHGRRRSQADLQRSHGSAHDFEAIALRRSGDRAMSSARQKDKGRDRKSTPCT